jgi:hypothetical protein
VTPNCIPAELNRTRIARGQAFRFLLSLVLALAISSGSIRAAIQFDVFLGYNGIIPEAAWFPVVCEIKNDGPTFFGTVELDTGTYNQGQVRRLQVELPTGTLKRVVLPVFSATHGYVSWDVRLLDERGKTRAEQTGLRPQKQIGVSTPLMGALPRTAGGTPQIEPIKPKQSELQPSAARLQPSIFPDNPLVLERLDCIYLNSERAADLTTTQVKALFAWLYAGGHLVVGVEQPADVTASSWLKNLVPCDLKDLKPLANHTALQEWVQNSWPTNEVHAVETQNNNPPQYYPGAKKNRTTRRNYSEVSPFSSQAADADFEKAPMQVAVGTIREGTIDVGTDSGPLVVTASRGRGRVTVLLFSPEREPVRSWKNLPTFWAKLAEVPAAYYVSSDFNEQGGWSSDGIFGAMVDTRQVHKLPVGWLLLLLLVYLVVIGPLDQYWLKRIGKPMLTWITFPCYVVAFSLVIYLIGYKLRAGESEWNELHLVDVLRNGERAELRGRTYSSVYSPSNQKYLLQSQQNCATLRGEFAGLWGGQSTEKATIVQNGDSFKAEIFVPVWTSQLFVSDWWHSAALPLTVTVTNQAGSYQVTVDNRTDTKLENLRVAVEGDIFILPGELKPNEAKTYAVKRESGKLIRDFVMGHAGAFMSAMQRRQHAFGESEGGQISDLAESSTAVSFLSEAGMQDGYNFLTPPGLDMSGVVARGDAVLFAWADNYSPVKPMYQFSPRRSHRHTLWRVAADVN